MPTRRSVLPKDRFVARFRICNRRGYNGRRGRYQNAGGETFVIAVCFQCGEPKMGPLAKCEFCKKKPGTRVEQIASMALSNECLKEHNLKRGSAYIKKTKRLPKFHESVQRKASQLVEAHLEVDDPKDSDSFDLSSAFFEFDFSQGGGETITVHAIGKPENVSDDYHGTSIRNTYHTMQWEIGKDIPAEIADANVDSAGEIFVWYRWMGGNWTWKCVSRVEFEQLKSVEA